MAKIYSIKDVLHILKINKFDSCFCKNDTADNKDTYEVCLRGKEESFGAFVGTDEEGYAFHFWF